MRIPLGLDLDSTISDFPQAAILYLHSQGFDDVHLANWTTKRLDKCFSVEVDNALREAMTTPEFWMSLEPLPGVIKELVKMMPEYELHIITQRHDWITQLTHDWLCLNEVPFDTLTLVQDKEEKLPKAQELNCFGFIDDDPDTCQQMHDSGIVTGQFIWPWNYIYEDMIRSNKWSGLAYAMDLKMKDKKKAVK